MLSRNSVTSTEPLTGNDYIDGILWGGKKLSSNRITYSFNSGSPSALTEDWNETEREVLEKALETWSAVADLEFVLVADDSYSADLRFNLGGDFESGVLGAFVPPGELGAGEGYFRPNELGEEDFADFEPGSEGFLAVIHEIGHGLGLAHPHDDAGGSSIYPGLDVSSSPEISFGRYGLNQGVWTTMSYNDGLNRVGYQGSPMAFDIAAIQHLYGANSEHAKGDNTYVMPVSNQDALYQGIWDTGGLDTISALSSFGDVTIDLRAAPLTGENAGGYLSSDISIDGGFTIANGVKIENARGGSGDDELVGNQLSNSLSAGEGDDTLTGGSQSDVMAGGADEDLLIGCDPEAANPGRGEYDRLTGGAGADIFALGDGSEVYYQGIGYATIADFNPLQGDRLQATGVASDYSFEDARNGTYILHDGDRVGYVAGTAKLSTIFDFQFV